jgi:hypothetical protein
VARDFAQLADVAAYIKGRMLFLLKQAEEDELLNGSGSGNHASLASARPEPKEAGPTPSAESRSISPSNSRTTTTEPSSGGRP